MASFTCHWCRGSFDTGSAVGSPTTCPSCGAAIDVRTSTTESGWQELPAIPDMARLQFGRSRVQIEGSYVPVADFSLGDDEAVYFSHHTLLWKDDAVPLTRSPNGSAWKRVMGGLPLIMAQATGPGRVALSMDKPGETVAVPMWAGTAVDVQEHHFLAASDEVGYDYLQSGLWYTTRSGNESETHYPVGRYLDRFFAVGEHGLLLLHAGGNVFERTLVVGETICVKPPALLFKDPSVGMALHVEQPSGASVWRSGYQYRHLWLRMWGPGRVAVQSQFGHFHDPGTRITRSSGMSTTCW